MSGIRIITVSYFLLPFLGDCFFQKQKVTNPNRAIAVESGEIAASFLAAH